MKTLANGSVVCLARKAKALRKGKSLRHLCSSTPMRIVLSAFYIAILVQCRSQSLFEVNDSLFRQLPDMLDTTQIFVEWEGYVVRPDTDVCVVNNRERLVGPRLAIYMNKARVGEIEMWTLCCRVIVRSVRIDSLVTAYSSVHGKYLSAVVSPTYHPCIETNETTNTHFRHWNLKDIYVLRDPISGKSNQEHELKDGSGYVTFTDTIFKPRSWTRISYSGGYRHGFTFTMIKLRNTDEFKFYDINTYIRSEQRGLYLRAEDDEHYAIGHIDLITDPSGKTRRMNRSYLVDQNGKATKYREYVEGENVPSYQRFSKPRNVPLCDPKGIMESLFSDALSIDYSRSWGFGNRFLNCAER